ncbi:MAG: hypothetical protein WBC71_01740 [Salaquimonas sp.]
MNYNSSGASPLVSTIAANAQLIFPSSQITRGADDLELHNEVGSGRNRNMLYANDFVGKAFYHL